MFDDVGKKIKIVASVICWIGIIISCMLGILLIYTDGQLHINNYTFYTYTRTELIIEGFVLMAVGSIISWIVSIMIYGFGELVDNSKLLRVQLDKTKEKLDKAEESLGRIEENLGKMEENLHRTEINLGKTEEKQPVISSQSALTTVTSSYDQLIEYLDQFDNTKKMLESLQEKPEEMDEDLYEKLCEFLKKLWNLERIYGLGKKDTMSEITKFLAEYGNQESFG